ncbi:retropepsin-like aspartic protease [Chitinophaga nivalis]|uniref:Retropepsin-like domain-containing protein n=1 Tax=Chitinophaga nivalis TaxID=2991709 RepID=A0ABT3IMH4_9BACT|nr:retropepsin-like aspartic protease [Chitinophaga nivalis]MCW3465129.1 retropepsin-like domain-containing protein [Chitinophaga nivalis]MCW3485179.1 retropepsin-like domain-containing protein [Chitinophaga nivalis]
MKSKQLLILVLIMCGQNVWAQKRMPMIRANSDQVRVVESSITQNNIWKISPRQKPDVMVANPFTGTQQVTFYTDIDSISFKVKPNSNYDFIILLNGTDTAYTRISTWQDAVPTYEPWLYYESTGAKHILGIDTIPFVLGKDNRIHFKGTVNKSDTLDFIFDTGANACVIKSSIVGKKVELHVNGKSTNVSSDGSRSVAVSKGNKMKVGPLAFKHVELTLIDYTADFPFDVVLGWTAFRDKVVEIDYERGMLLIHDSLPEMMAGYSRLDMKIDAIPYVKCKLAVNGKEMEGWFDFDTGSDGSLHIGYAFAKNNSMKGTMKVIGKAASKGTANLPVSYKLVLLPALKLGTLEMYQVPVYMSEEERANMEIIGNNILKRFNTIIDFKGGAVYLKPNTLFYASPLIV